MQLFLSNVHRVFFFALKMLIKDSEKLFFRIFYKHLTLLKKIKENTVNPVTSSIIGFCHLKSNKPKDNVFAKKVLPIPENDNVKSVTIVAEHVAHLLTNEIVLVVIN